MSGHIKIYGAKQNNLKNINLALPKNQFIVFTGLSGSGKSTMAFDTLYAEGQRRYMESLSSYARQFLDRLDKPDVEKIEGLSPAIAIDQKSSSKNPRSTLGTVTEIYDYLRLLYARIGTQHCYSCGKKISKQSEDDIINEVLRQSGKAILYAPLVKEKKGSFIDLFDALRKKGFLRLRVDGAATRLDEDIELDKNKKHTIDLIIDRFEIKEENRARITQAVEKALEEGFGLALLENLDSKSEKLFSKHNACLECKISYELLEPLSFSFNSHKGACPGCDGLGVSFTLDMSKIVNQEASIEEGAIRTLHGFNKSYYAKFLQAFCEQNNIPTSVPYQELDSAQQRMIMYGSGGVATSLEWNKQKINRNFEGAIKISYDLLKNETDLEEYMCEKSCNICHGHRLNAASRHVKVAGKYIGEILDMPIDELSRFFSNAKNFASLSDFEKQICSSVLREITERIFFLVDLGLGYLSLGRDARTISGGEAQRIRIASQIGSGLSGVMYVLDEPSIGLHERDSERLIRTLRSLQAKDNTLIVVEHDRKTIESADFVVEIGPGAGVHGGEVVFSGSYDELLRSGCNTAAYLSRSKDIWFKVAKKTAQNFLEIKNVNIHNIKELDVSFPLEELVVITGVSGSGKSSLMLQTLLPAAREALNRAKKVRKIDGVEINGLEHLDKIIYLDQSPIGRTPRSNPATYTGLMDEIRALFASTQEAKLRGYKPGRFSFNVSGGRCEKCQGEGTRRISMSFLPDVLVNCDACSGSRYNQATREIFYKDKNISQVLDMSVEEALEFFAKLPKFRQKLQTLFDVGLGYVKLGQNATTLSGGEAQRVKLAKELSRSDTGRTLYLLDEPTTGLHFEDTNKLVMVLKKLVELKNSVFVIEHNLDVIKNADYLIDLGPEGGRGGGQVVDSGSPMELAKRWQKTGSFTGKYLAREFEEMGISLPKR